jgi:hypothetical protein
LVSTEPDSSSSGIPGSASWSSRCAKVTAIGAGSGSSPMSRSASRNASVFGTVYGPYGISVGLSLASTAS